MYIDDDNIEIICTEDKESEYIDFKSQYSISKDKKLEIIRDIMAFANSNSKGDKHIIIGVREDQVNNRNIIVGVNEPMEISKIEEMLRSNVEPSIKIELETYEVQEKNIKVLKIKEGNYKNRPFLMKKKLTNMNSVMESGQGTIREGTRKRNLELADFKKIFSEKRTDGKIDILLYNEETYNFTDELKESKEELKNLINEFNGNMKFLKKLKEEKEDYKKQEKINTFPKIRKFNNGIQTSGATELYKDFIITDMRENKIKKVIGETEIVDFKIPFLKTEIKIGLYNNNSNEISSAVPEAEKTYKTLEYIEEVISEMEVMLYFNERKTSLFYIQSTVNVENIEINIENFKVPRVIENIEEIVEQIERFMIHNKKEEGIKPFKEEKDIIKEEQRLQFQDILFLSEGVKIKDFQDVLDCFDSLYDNVEYLDEENRLILNISILNKNEKVFFPFRLFNNGEMSYQISSSLGEFSGNLYSH